MLVHPYCSDLFLTGNRVLHGALDEDVAVMQQSLKILRWLQSSKNYVFGRFPRVFDLEIFKGSALLGSNRVPLTLDEYSR